MVEGSRSSPERTHAYTGRTCKLHTERPQVGIESVGLHDEINWVIAIVGLCSLSEGNYPWIFGGEWIESLAQSVSYPGTIGGAVPISAIANRATSCWRLHHQQQQQTQAFRKMVNEEQDEATSLCICDELVMAQTRCTTPLLVVMIMEERRRRWSLPLTSGSRPREKNLEHAQNSP